MVWSVPPDTPLFYKLSAHLPFRSERPHHPSADWMRAGDVDTLSGQTPGGVRGWPGAPAVARRLRLVVDGHAVVLVCTTRVSPSTRIRPTRRSPRSGLSARALMQLCFGYRPAWWFARKPNAAIPVALLPVLDVLFPASDGMGAASDARRRLGAMVSICAELPRVEHVQTGNVGEIFDVARARRVG
ncbi:MAG: hypothetical protein R2838_10585 [Caldilineaceae bacterium]